MAPVLEVADIFRRHGEAFRQARAEHLDRVERRVMGAITACRTAVLGGHVEQCDDCGATRIAYNSCLMGKAGNGELAIAITVFSCVLPLSSSPLEVARAAPLGRPLMAGHIRRRTCWRRTSRQRRCWGICAVGRAGLTLTGLQRRWSSRAMAPRQRYAICERQLTSAMSWPSKAQA